MTKSSTSAVFKVTNGTLCRMQLAAIPVSFCDVAVRAAEPFQPARPMAGRCLGHRG